MQLFKWQKGRQQNCEYYKYPIWYFKLWKFGFDCYILKYPPFAKLPKHKDIIINSKHYRLNICLKGYSLFHLENNVIDKTFIYFRPDLQEHSLTVTSSGCIKLSLGFVKFN